MRFLVLFLIFSTSCFSDPSENQETQAIEIKDPNIESEKEVIVGAARFEKYLPLLKSKNIALVVNQTSTIGTTHLVDTLLSLGMNIQKIFSPEHGFRGTADAGEKVKSGKDLKTGLPLISLYGKNKKPNADHLQGIDWIIFDIQDVGARFYTYISTMTYVMEACAESDIPFLVLDRPNPNGHYVDGPILKESHKSFIGLHSVPVVHGMTIGEYAKMIIGEQWIKKAGDLKLEIVACQNYDHQTFYEVPIKPSPNLPNMKAIYCYPSLCFFEGTNVSVGRGTVKQFQIFGSPENGFGDYTFIPEPMPGAKYPKHEGQKCRGEDLSLVNLTTFQKSGKLDLSYLIKAFKHCSDQSSFFLENLFFDKLAGGESLRLQIEKGKSEEEIKASWQEGLNHFKSIRKKYLIYRDFSEE